MRVTLVKNFEEKLHVLLREFFLMSCLVTDNIYILLAKDYSTRNNAWSVDSGFYAYIFSTI